MAASYGVRSVAVHLARVVLVGRRAEGLRLAVDEGEEDAHRRTERDLPQDVAKVANCARETAGDACGLRGHKRGEPIVCIIYGVGSGQA